MPSMRTAGPGCCCCPDFWVFTRYALQLGWRGLHTVGTYPDNDVTIDPEPANQPFGQRISADYRNKKFYLGTIKQSDTTKIELVEYDFHFGNRRVILEFARFGSPSVPVLAIDYVNGRLFYSKWIVYELGVPDGEFEQEIRRVDLDGSNDTLVFTKSWTEVSTGQLGGVFQLIYEPVNNYLFYTYAHFEKHLKGGPPATLDANNYTELYRCNADDGTAETTIVALADTVSVHGDWNITGIGVFPQTEKLFWIQRHGTPAGGDVDIMTSDLDGGSATSIWFEAQNDGNSSTRCFPCEKDQRIYFETVEFPPSMGERRRLSSIEQNGDDFRDEFHNQQGDWNDGDDDGSSLRTGQTMWTRLACNRELTGEEFNGSGYS